MLVTDVERILSHVGAIEGKPIKGRRRFKGKNYLVGFCENSNGTTRKLSVCERKHDHRGNPGGFAYYATVAPESQHMLQHEIERLSSKHINCLTSDM